MLKIQIKLLSDLCLSDGKSYNSLVDTDVCYDNYGIPYIPAKRLKGCIREAFTELADWGIVEKEHEEILFGGEGMKNGQLSLSNGKVADRQGILAAIAKLQNQEGMEHIASVQNVLNCFTYMRTQTAMQSGVAVKNSLRTIRVIKKGLQFEAECELASEEYLEELKKAVRNVSHMGLNRTRGLGLVSLELVEDQTNQETGRQAKPAENKNRQGLCAVGYSIRLQAPMLVRSSGDAPDYIEGAKVLGLLADDIVEKGIDFNTIIASNAYICGVGKRCTPAAASIFKKKDSDYGEDGKLKTYDLLFDLTEEEKELQKASLGHAYCNVERVTMSVSSSVDYHHRRPEDKSIGHANGTGNSVFYQVKVLEEGQEFQGFLIVPGEALEQLVEIAENYRTCRMGYSKQTQYGVVSFCLDSERVVELEKREAWQVQEFVVKLNAPTILYNEFGVSTTEDKEMIEALAKRLGCQCSDLEVLSKYKTYTQIGGFNTRWHRRKPVQKVLDKGTVYRIHSQIPVDIGKLAYTFIGERIREGYGEIQVQKAEPIQWVCRQTVKESTVTDQPVNQSILRELILHDAISQARMRAIREADILAGRYLPQTPTISKMIQMNKDHPTKQDFEQEVDTFKETQKDKWKEMKDVLKTATETFAWIQTLDETIIEDVYQTYMFVYLSQLKYKRKEKGVKHE